MTPKRKLFGDISASAVQLLIMQLSGAVIFYLLSNLMPKQDIGFINWSLALLMIIYAVLGFGIDQITVKKIATGTNPQTFVPVYLFHVFITGIGFLIVAGVVSVLPGMKAVNANTFLLLALNQLLLYISTPFKQVANGMEQFRSLLAMSVIANITRVIGICILIIYSRISLPLVTWLYVFSSLLELLGCIIIYRSGLRMPLRLLYNAKNYALLIRESLPQLGIIFFTALIARFDWVLLGLFCSTAVVADYGFAYKFFELSTLPLLIVAPLLLPKIARLLQPGVKFLPKQSNDQIIGFIKTEMIIATVTILVINTCWTPVIDFITNGKYGHNNANTVLLLSFSIPFLYINNMLWSLHFSQGRLKEILKIFMLTSFVNIAADLLLIPYYQSGGAATGFVLATVVQTIFFLRKTSLYGYTRIFWNLGLTLLAAALAWYTADFFFNNTMGRLLCSSSVYLLFLISINNIRSGDASLLSSPVRV